MTVKSAKKGYKKTKLTNSLTIGTKKRGRPKGAKNKPKHPPAPTERVVVKKRGRPKGAKNKPRVDRFCAETKPTPEKLVKAKPAKPPEAYELLHALAHWLEKKMHPSEMQYYRSRATKLGCSVQQAVISDILGFFNVQDLEINKQIKKNNFIATTNHELNAKN